MQTRHLETRGWMAIALVSVIALGACNREGAKTAAPAATAAAAKPLAAPAPMDPKRRRWDGVVAPAENWPRTVATDVLLRAGAPGLDPEAVDAAAKPVASALRAVAGVERVVTRARAGELRLVVRFGQNAVKGPTAVGVVLAAWRAAAPTAFAEPRADAIARGGRALAMLESVAMGGRVEATRYADMHPDLLIQAAHWATRTHLAGAVRPLLTARVAPSSLFTHGIQLTDIVDALHAWLAKSATLATTPGLDDARIELEEIKVKRHWATAGQPLPPVTLDRLVDLSVEQGEATREARNGHLPITFWLIDSMTAGESTDIDQAARKVAGESKEIFRQSVQSLGGAYRFIVVAPEGDPQLTMNTLSDRLKLLRERNESIVAINAIAGHDGVPEDVDSDAWTGRCWTIWISNASADVGAMVFTVREALSAGGWEVHPVSSQSDTALEWVLDAWGAGGALISAEDASVLAPDVGELAERALAGREKAGMRQGPQPAPAPWAYQRVDPKALARTKLPVDAREWFVDILGGPQPFGWWHETPVWLGLPVGDLAATVGQLPLNWLEPGGSGPEHAWLAADVLRVADKTPVIERVRVDGRAALWAVPEDYSDAPDAVAASFWRLVEATVELRVGMRVDSLEVRQKGLVGE